MGILDNFSGAKKNVPLEQARVNMLQTEEQFKLLCLELGNFVFQKSERGEEVSADYLPLISKIRQAKANQESFRANWLQLQGLMECKNCNRQIPFGSVFCSNCGKKANEAEMDSGAMQTEYQYKDKCMSCGVELEEDATFCTNCGTRRG